MDTSSVADIEHRAARLADPGVDLKTKHIVACELREAIDNVSGTEFTRVFHNILPHLIDLLRNGEPAFVKDSPEFPYRKALLDILHRCPLTPESRPHIVPLFSGLLYILRHDNEENGVTACKTIVDVYRAVRAFPEDLVSEIVVILQELLQNMPGLVQELLSPDSTLPDANSVLHSTRSFKVLAEMGVMLIALLQNRSLPPAVIPLVPIHFPMLNLQPVQQQKAREDTAAMDGIWFGMSPDIRNRQAYEDLITAQTKIATYITYVMRSSDETFKAYGEMVVQITVRLLQDAPSKHTTCHKDLHILFRHLMTTAARKAILPSLNSLLDSRVLIGTALANYDMLRASQYFALADPLMYLRGELSPAQIANVITTYSRLLCEPNVIQGQLNYARVLFSFVEVILAKDTQNAPRILSCLLETVISRLETMVVVLDQIRLRLASTKSTQQRPVDVITIEEDRPIRKAAWAYQPPEDCINESRNLFRFLVHGARMCLSGLKKCDAPCNDGSVFARLFEACTLCMSALFDSDQQHLNETLESFASLLAEANVHVFQEFWTQKIEFFFAQSKKRPGLLQICQLLFGREGLSPTLVGIVLHFLLERLPELGNEDESVAVVTIRLYKMTFGALAVMPVPNEPILASCLGKLIMDCFPLAAKAIRPSHYFLLLRGLFRAIGQGGGKFELLYKEVLLLLPEMLECLNRQLHASDGQVRDIIVELFLTVPLRLTPLIPHLQYLMRPLVLALRGGNDFTMRGGTELVMQGLRTLELCIDNLTQDFIDPTLNTVLRDLMDALQEHLKPLPANHIQAHTTIRILGKLGGRNRKLLLSPPPLKYRPYAPPAQVEISFGSSRQKITIRSAAMVAARHLRKTSDEPSWKHPSPFCRAHALEYVKNICQVLLSTDVQGRESQDVLIMALEGLFDAMFWPEQSEEAKNFLYKVSRHILRAEISTPGSRRHASQALACYLEALPHALAREDAEEASKALAIVEDVIRDLVTIGQRGEHGAQEVMAIMRQIAACFSALCLDALWFRKRAGCNGIKLMTTIPDGGVQWIVDRETELVKTLLLVLKDLPADLPRDVDAVIDVMSQVLRTGNHGPPTEPAAQKRITNTTAIFFHELSNPNLVVRRASRSGIKLLSAQTGISMTDLMMPRRDYIMAYIYSKPLRALTYAAQIGLIEAVRFCVSLEPPLAELNDELLRLLHEVLGFADSEDASLLGHGNPRQASIDITNLRVACIKLLTASMPLTEFFVKQPQTRQRATTAYFKSVYSSSPEVKEVAYEGLKRILTHQTRLPRELLQLGLRPILTNLGDPKRLSAPGLDGLARLLELLTSYFKVEIGGKLLDHFRFVADPQMLQASSKVPVQDNEGVAKLVKLANLFHLLPAGAEQFLEALVNAIVQAESQLHFSSRSPLSEPLAKYLNRFPTLACDFFMRHFQFPRHVQTVRSILQARLADKLEREFMARSSALVDICFRRQDRSMLIPGLLLCSDLIEINPAWLQEYPVLVDEFVKIWKAEAALANAQLLVPEAMQRHDLLVKIFCKALEQHARIDLLFELVSASSRWAPNDSIQLTHFFYQHVALSGSLHYRRNVLLRFLVWFDDMSVSWSDKTQFIRLVITPMFVVHATRATTNEDKKGLIDDDVVNRFLRRIWQPMIENTVFANAEDSFKLELLHLTTVLLHHYPDSLSNVKKEVIQCAWLYITNDDSAIQGNAYLLAARFFEAFESPLKFLLRAWTGLLKPPHAEYTRPLTRQALDILAPVLPRSGESGNIQWAQITRKLLAEDAIGLTQTVIIYQLIVRQPRLFYPVRHLFVPHMVSTLSRLGSAPVANADTRLLSIDIVQVIFDWDCEAMKSSDPHGTLGLPTRENVVSYLLRTASTIINENTLVPRALTLLKTVVGAPGWNEVNLKLAFFLRALEQNDFSAPAANAQSGQSPGMSQAINAAKVLSVISANQVDDWFSSNALILQRLVRKGLVVDEHALHDALHPIFDRLVRIFPLPKEDDEQHSELADFHAWIYSAIGDGLRGSTAIRGPLLMLKSVVESSPERIESFHASLVRLASKLAKTHTDTQPGLPGYEDGVRLITAVLEICRIAVAFLGEQRRWMMSCIMSLVEKSKSIALCSYMLGIAHDWALGKRETYPTMKEKANVLRAMAHFENRGEPLATDYFELILDIYSDQSLRRSELTTRLEPCFLLGCRAKDAKLRERFIELLDSSIPRSLFSRLTYVLAVQSWDQLSAQYWISLALRLLLGSADGQALLGKVSLGFADDSSNMESEVRASSILKPMQALLYFDAQAAHDTFVDVFAGSWACLSRNEQTIITQHMIALLSKEYHIRQAELRPNIIQTLLTAVLACRPPMPLPPHLVKYLGKTYGAWHVSLELLDQSLEHGREDESSIRETVCDSLAELYAELAEDDLFYGLWRRRSLHQDTNNALAFEQHGMWDQASQTYENAMTKTRAGAIAFSEAEFCLWEDHWMLAQEKLQNWDLLNDMARAEGNWELVLESSWRMKNWADPRDKEDKPEDEIASLPDVATPRRRVFEAFVALLKSQGSAEKPEFARTLEEAMQLTLRKWVALPSRLSAAHVPLLQHFQQFVELQEAVSIFASLDSTTAQNLEKKSSELKMVLQGWRERLPDVYDDITIWSDLVAWRQNVFNAINKAYLPLTSNGAGGGATAGTAETFGYRGYHETAWIINRFAHVARKHDLLEVCFNSLTKIYTLPNIEISEAFLKLREQARCHYQKPNDLGAGLDVINNTNLMYFSPSQKAEFFTLKGMFYAGLGNPEEANGAFSHAVQLDMTQAKAWAEWGKYNDRLFKENPADASYAAHALSSYLQAAGMFKSAKSRPLQARILWLLSVDDQSLQITRQFDTYKGDAAFWYWIHLIPQLCMSLSQREGKQARFILVNLARLYPQALFYHLRTTREELRRSIEQPAQIAAARAAAAAAVPQAASTQAQSPDHPMGDATSSSGGTPSPLRQPAETPQPQNLPTGQDVVPLSTRHAWEYVEDVVQALKAQFPLLSMTLENLVEQMDQKFKPTSDEDCYRLICMLLSDAHNIASSKATSVEDDGQVPQHTVMNVMRMSHVFPSTHRNEFEEDFLRSKPTYTEYVKRLQRWRDRSEALLDSRPRTQPLNLLSNFLAEFQYGKFDDVEVPGQYTEAKDNHTNFIKIRKFDPRFENCRMQGHYWKRITVHGNDHSKTTFAAASLSINKMGLKAWRREDRVGQLFRSFNGHLMRRKEARKRALNFYLPALIPCTLAVRLAVTDPSCMSLADVYDQHCRERGFEREDPQWLIMEKMKTLMKQAQATKSRVPNKSEYFSVRHELFNEVVTKMVPNTVLNDHIIRTMDGPEELWRFRRQFAFDIASNGFITYVMCIGARQPVRFNISRATGRVQMTDLLPGTGSNAPLLACNETVPFRFTPNIQRFIGDTMTEGIVNATLVALGRCLTKPLFELDSELCLFARDEVILWLGARNVKTLNTSELAFRGYVAQHIDGIVKRAETFACKIEREETGQNPAGSIAVPTVQTATTLMNNATNPLQLAKMPETFIAWF